MRGAAALLVMLFHLKSHGLALVGSGYLAVDFFFVLSGFVIARSYDARLLGGMTFGGFAIARIVRLYPFVLAGLLLGVLNQSLQIAAGSAVAMSKLKMTVGAVSGALMLPSIATPSISPINFPAWSLILELAINLIYAAWLVRLRLRWLAAVCLACLGVLALAAGVGGTIDQGFNWHLLFVGLARVGFSFGLGVIVSRIHPTADRSRWTSVALIAALVGLLLVRPSPEARPFFEMAFVMLGAPGLLWLGASLQPPARLEKTFALLGDLSYPVYAIHAPLLGMCDLAASRLGVGHLIWVPVYVVTTVLAASLLGRYWDVPVRAWITRFAFARPAARRTNATA